MALVLRIAALVGGTVALAACGGDVAAPADPVVASETSPARRAAVPEPSAEAPSRLRDDRGGWDPAADLLDLAARLGDPATKAEALGALDALPRARRIDVLRAGLRLRDDAAARACAARLEWQWIDGWECARCVDLLIADVLRPGTEADLDVLRSYLGSTDLPRFFAEAPPLPWAVPAGDVMGAMHRLIRAEHAELWISLAENKNPEIADAAWSEYSGTVLARTDANREAVQRRHMRDDGGRTPTGPGLPPVTRRCFRDALDGTLGTPEEPWSPGAWHLRWMFSSKPSEDDAALLCDAVERLPPGSPAREAAILLLGLLQDARSDALLRRLAGDDEFLALLAIARRGNASALETLANLAREDWAESPEALTTLMEVEPVRARQVLDDVLLGDDGDPTELVLWRTAQLVTPGAIALPSGHPDWRRTSLTGLESAALAHPLPPVRLAWMALVFPECRTRRVAADAAARLTRAELELAAHLDARGDLDLRELWAFVETGAPDAFRTALRRIAAGRGDAGGGAMEFLLAMGDEESAATLVAELPEVDDALIQLARANSPLVRADLERRLDAAAKSGDEDELGHAVAALAAFHGLPEEATWGLRALPISKETIEHVRAGRPVDALLSQIRPLLDDPDPDDPTSAGPKEAGDVGVVRDPRVLDWLREVRSRRDLGAYWYATGQLSAAGDPDARREFWQAVRDGRYRIVDEASTFALTLGHDLAATLPHWIAELETNCCRANDAEMVLRETIGFESNILRTDVSRAREIWDAARGRFVRSRILGRWVPEPR